MYMDKYYKWLNEPTLDVKNKKLLADMSDEEIKDSFYKDLSFGTGGLRGILGIGSNRMNIYTVRKATQGLADYIIKHKMKKRGVAIAFDSRHMSQEFAYETANVLCANGIKAYLYSSLRPTPQLSFTVRYYKCAAGVVITASHNPAQYNGYKVYASDGAQITPPLDQEIIDCVNSVDVFNDVKTLTFDQALNSKKLILIPEEVDEAYLDAVSSIILRPEAIKNQKDNIKICYTPLHGAGLVPVYTILERIGFKKIYIVKEQALPDGRFPTLSYPNPEDPDAFKLALEEAKRVDADIVLATDPDADRLGVSVKDNEGIYHYLTGNMIGALLLEYELSQRRILGLLPKHGAVVKTIVTGRMSDAIAAAYHVKLIETLTGFKYIGEQIKLFEKKSRYSYLFGYEESYGFLIGTHSRDKDAVSAVCALCEACAFYKSKNKTLWEQMQYLYDRYGYYLEDISTKVYPGADGAEQIRAILNNLRQNPLKKAGGLQVISVTDYLDTNSSGLPASDVLLYKLEKNAWFCIRPSGTEPKIKLYMGVKGFSSENALQLITDLKNQLINLIS